MADEEEEIQRKAVSLKRKELEDLGIVIPENGNIQSYPTRPKVHKHHLFKCDPIK
jgi:hypothetical protein